MAAEVLVSADEAEITQVLHEACNQAGIKISSSSSSSSSSAVASRSRGLSPGTLPIAKASATAAASAATAAASLSSAAPGQGHHLCQRQLAGGPPRASSSSSLPPTSPSSASPSSCAAAEMPRVFPEGIDRWIRGKRAERALLGKFPSGRRHPWQLTVKEHSVLDDSAVSWKEAQGGGGGGGKDEKSEVGLAAGFRRVKSEGRFLCFGDAAGCVTPEHERGAGGTEQNGEGCIEADSHLEVSKTVAAAGEAAAAATTDETSRMPLAPSSPLTSKTPLTSLTPTRPLTYAEVGFKAALEASTELDISRACFSWDRLVAVRRSEAMASHADSDSCGVETAAIDAAEAGSEEARGRLPRSFSPGGVEMTVNSGGVVYFALFDLSSSFGSPLSPSAPAASETAPSLPGSHCGQEMAAKHGATYSSVSRAANGTTGRPVYGAACIKFSPSRLTTQSERFGSELSRHLHVATPQARAIHRSSSEWLDMSSGVELARDNAAAAAAAGAAAAAATCRERAEQEAERGEEGKEETAETVGDLQEGEDGWEQQRQCSELQLTASTCSELLEALQLSRCVLFMGFVHGDPFQYSPHLFSSLPSRLRAAKSLARIFVVDLLLRNEDRLPCATLGWRGNPCNLLVSRSRLCRSSAENETTNRAGNDADRKVAADATRKVGGKEQIVHELEDAAAAAKAGRGMKQGVKPVREQRVVEEEGMFRGQAAGAEEEDEEEDEGGRGWAELAVIDSSICRRPPPGKMAMDQEQYPKLVELLLNDEHYAALLLEEISGGVLCPGDFASDLKGEMKGAVGVEGGSEVRVERGGRAENASTIAMGSESEEWRQVVRAFQRQFCVALAEINQLHKMLVMLQSRLDDMLRTFIAFVSSFSDFDYSLCASDSRKGRSNSVRSSHDLSPSPSAATANDAASPSDFPGSGGDELSGADRDGSSSARRRKSRTLSARRATAPSSASVKAREAKVLFHESVRDNEKDGNENLTACKLPTTAASAGDSPSAAAACREQETSPPKENQIPPADDPPNPQLSPTSRSSPSAPRLSPPSRATWFSSLSGLPSRLSLKIRGVRRSAMTDDDLREHVELWDGIMREEGLKICSECGFTTGFLEGGSVFVDAYELKVRLEHLIERMNLLQQGAATERPNQVLPGVLIGSAVTARSLHLLRHLGVSHILSLCPSDLVASDDDQPNGFAYLPLSIRDTEDEDIRRIFDAAFDFINDALKSNGRVLVHCFEGRSRSATIVLAYLMAHMSMPLASAWSRLRSVHPNARPNDGFMQILCQLDQALFGRRSLEFVAKRPALRTCSVCCKPVGLSSDSLKLHMQRMHPGTLPRADGDVAVVDESERDRSFKRMSSPARINSLAQELSDACCKAANEEGPPTEVAKKQLLAVASILSAERVEQGGEDRGGGLAGDDMANAS